MTITTATKVHDSHCSCLGYLAFILRLPCSELQGVVVHSVNSNIGAQNISENADRKQLKIHTLLILFGNHDMSFSQKCSWESRNIL